MKKIRIYLISFFICLNCVFQNAADVYGVTTLDEKSKPPDIYAQAGVLIEATSGTVLYDKNMNEKMYPASITKILTALLALENSSLNETVTFSHYSIYSLEPGAAHIAMKENEQISMKDTLHGVMLNSANECANAAGEHVGKQTEAYKAKIQKLKKENQEYDESRIAVKCFVDMMNGRAKEIGAVNTHFANPHGLFDENHYTTSYDMALIMREAIQNSNFLKIESNVTYTIGATKLTNEPRYLKNRHAMLCPDKPEYYEDAFAGKTGYVDQSGNTLVTVAKRGDMTLISVVMKTDTYHVYDDTKLLLDYGFNNYKCVNIAENETKFSLANDGFFGSIGSVFSENKPLLGINSKGFVILPKEGEFSQLTSEITFDSKGNSGSNSIASIHYYYGKQKVGTTTLDLIEQNRENPFQFGPSKTESVEEDTGQNRWLRIDLRIIFAILIILILGLFVWRYILFSKSRGSRRRIRKERHGTRRSRRKEFAAKRRRSRRDTGYQKLRRSGRDIHHRHRHHYR